MISRFFIERPRVSAVLSIILILIEILAIQVLPVKEYPALTPPLEEAINSVPNMVYMTSIASSSGILAINCLF